MSVIEIGQLHTRYVRLSDKFKAIWTYNQFAIGVYKNVLPDPLPYHINFQQSYEEIRRAYDVIQSGNPSSAIPMMDRSDAELQSAIEQLISADHAITASILRRFFEKIRKQDEKIIYNLIKFYLYAGAVEGDPRDKLDFLFTQLAEEYIDERSEYTMRDSLELRKTFQSLVSLRPLAAITQDEVIQMIRTIRGLRDEIVKAESFDELAADNLLDRARALKHSIGDLMFHPDVLLAIVDGNITTKNRFARLYQDEETKIIEDARRLLDNESAIARGFGQSNPALLDEMERFKRFKLEFEDSREHSNVKHNVISQLKASMNNILTQLDQGLDGAEPEVLSESFFSQYQQDDMVQTRFGDDPVLYPYLLKIVSVLDNFEHDATLGKMAGSPEAQRLRLENWEVSAFQKLFWGSHRREGESDELLMVYLRAAALRLKIDDEARDLVAVPARQTAPTPLLERCNASLTRAKELDAQFKEFMQENISLSNAKNLQRLNRSLIRLLRAFSGLWLIYDQHMSSD